MRFIYTKAFAIFSACVLLLAFLVFLQVRGWLDPIRTAALQAPRPVVFLVSSVVSPVKNFFGTIYQLKEIIQENTRLRARVTELETNLINYNQESRENEALRKELGFVQNSKQAPVACTVLSRNQFGLSDSVILNCGTERGVQEGQAITSQGYLVGKIVYAGKDSSTALLLTRADCATDARVSQSLASAVVRGSFGSGFILDQVPQSSDLQKGWLVVTAGISAQIPKNILIGEVDNMLSTDNELFKRAALVSPIDFDNLEFVFVVK